MSRKRSWDEVSFSAGSTLSRLNDDDAAERESIAQLDGEARRDDEGGEWEVVKRRKTKPPKKEKDRSPGVWLSHHARLQSYVKLGDLQNLVLYLLADGSAPQWISVKHKDAVQRAVVLMVPGLESGMFDGYISLSSSTEESGVDGAFVTDGKLYIADRAPDAFYPTKLKPERMPAPLRPLSDMFEHIWPVRTPGDDKYARMHSPLAAILTAPIVKTQEEKNRKGKGPQPPTEGRSWKNKRTPVTELLATQDELAGEGYVIHPAGAQKTEEERRNLNGWTHANGWVDVPDIPSIEAGNAPDETIEAGSVTAGRKILALDCEMCITSPKGVTPQVFSLTRASLIDWNGDVVMDALVKPADPITDYLTPYSGITPAMLENVTTSLAEIQQKLLQLITPQTILVGHSLDSDLKALKLTHPFVIDTALLFPHPRGPPLKSSLKWLAQKYLAREIQKGHGSTGHNSIEDARACLDLVKQKCEKGKAWGTPEASVESIFKRLSRTMQPKQDKAAPDVPRTGAVVDWGEPARGYGGQANVTMGCENDEQVVAWIERALGGGPLYQPNVPENGCDLVWGRLRELEAYRGWWERSKLLDSDALRFKTKDAISEKSLSDVLALTVRHIKEVYDALPPCTAFIVYSGSGDPIELREMSAMQQQFKEEYKVKKWDQLTVRWTDVEEQRLRRACEKARKGVAFLTIKA